MAYLLCRVIAWLNKEVTISFLLVGDTKLAPRQGFCLFKRVFRIGTTYNIAEMVWKSAVFYHPQLISDYDGNMFLKFHKWSSIFRDYTDAIKVISQYQHFQISSSDPGFVFVWTAIDKNEKRSTS